jgi:hypothetical protein
VVGLVCYGGINAKRMAHRAEPVPLTWLQMRVSGVTLFEDGLKASKPGYRAHIAGFVIAVFVVGVHLVLSVGRSLEVRIVVLAM